jgi:ABC-type amino acid transport substrate-binding protein
MIGLATSSRRALLVAAVAALLPAVRAAAADKPAFGLKQPGVLRVLRMNARDDDEFFSVDPGSTRPGLDREILEGFAKLHGLRLEPVTVPSWEDLIPGLLEGKGDVAAGRFTITAARQAQVDFTTEVFPTRHVVLTRKPRPSILTRDELRTVKIGAVKGSAIEEAILAAGIPPAQIVHIEPASSTSVLKDGRIGAVVANVESALRGLSEDPQVQIGMYLGPPRSLAYALRKDDKELRAALDSYIENTRRSAAWNRLVVKYFGNLGLEILKTVRN